MEVSPANVFQIIFHNFLTTAKKQQQQQQKRLYIGVRVKFMYYRSFRGQHKLIR